MKTKQKTADEIINDIRSRVKPKNKKVTKPVDMTDEGRLFCPCCKDEESNLHHTRVEVFNRQEDAEQGTHVNIQGSHVTIDGNLESNPSPRREGVSIVFWCEQCDTESVLDIIQHKGHSYMRWYEGKEF